ncbi:hypothetical protein CSA56_05085 [candidate division KSB3 bacterium]|uniref:HTH marR-type domain-containing protein n=1 Tax=candidate division KSB3 bacterium TaxID=2044937 RepID=A0A2G6KHS1_9BACT|nr:MAG: hypothetical protein CSA56_05085 [candidate division KSB3 bacterium]
MHAIEKIGITTGSLTVAIDKLEKRGVVVRTPNPDDRRSCVIELTAVGQEVHREHSHYHLNMTQECTAGFSESEKEQFALFIQRFLQNV